MKKKTWGIILIVLAAMGILGSLANGSLLSMGGFTLVGFFAAFAALLYFGIKFIKSGE